MYKIIRFKFEGQNRTIKRGLTLEQARKHCSNPETSSRTCSPSTSRRIPGTWFDGYEKT